MNQSVLGQIAQVLVASHKGILAADESSGTIKKRFDAIGLESTEETRRAYRELLFTTPEIEKYISGVIMFDETIRQSGSDGTPFAELLASRGIIPGIKVDQGTKPLDGSTEELITVGFDGLADRLKEYKTLGAQFAKWRAVIKIGESIPTTRCLEENAQALAEYARICQAADIVPIVEPEVLMDGAHTIERCFAVTTQTLHLVFSTLKEKGVHLSGMLLKPNMIVPGEVSGQVVGLERIADDTVRCLRAEVSADVPGMVFLSGGQSEQEATVLLSLMNVRHKSLPWKLSFSYGRALQASALKTWQGKSENVGAAQQVFQKRAKLNSFACAGIYSVDKEKA